MDYEQNKELNEDHFSTDQVSQIKACQDESVKSFYKKYLQAEATGDTEQADRYAGIITKRCNLIGVFAAEGCSSDMPESTGPSMYEAWETKMKNAGATKIAESDSSSIAYKRHGVDTYVLGEFDRLTNSEVFESFRTSPTYKKYTGQGDSSALDLWKEYVLAEGATDLKTVGKDLYAYLGESRIGKFTLTSPVKEVKSFGQLLNETMTIDVSVSPDGEKKLFAQADSDDANYLSDILRNAGVNGWAGGGMAPMAGPGDLGISGDPMAFPPDDAGIGADELGSEFDEFGSDDEFNDAGIDDEFGGDYEEFDLDAAPDDGVSQPEFGLEEEFANEPNEKYVDADTQLITMAGGLNKPHRQSNPNNPADNPLAMKKLGKMSSPSLNLEESLAAEFAAFTPTVSEGIKDEIRRFKRGRLADKKSAEEWAKASDAEKKGDKAGADKHFRRHTKYHNLTSPNQWTKVVDEPVNESTLDDKIKNAEAKVKKLSGQKKGTKLSADVDERLKNAKAELAKLKKQKGQKVKLGETELGKYADQVMTENERLAADIGDEVSIIAEGDFNGLSGVVAEFGRDRKFVIVDLYTHGRQSFRSSDVLINA